MRWQEFAATVADLLREHGVTLTASMMGLPATLPHTRPTFVHQTGSSSDVIPDQPEQPGVVTMRASMDLYLQSYLGRVGFDSVGMVVGVPYYLADSEYPAASVSLIERLADLSKVSLPLGDLEAYAATMRTRVDQAVAETEELGEVIATLEKEYDTEEWGSGLRTSPGASPLPSGEALAQSLADYLAHTDRQRAKRFDHDSEDVPRSVMERLRRRGRHASGTDSSGDTKGRGQLPPAGRHRRPSDG